MLLHSSPFFARSAHGRLKRVQWSAMKCNDAERGRKRCRRFPRPSFRFRSTGREVSRRSAGRSELLGSMEERAHVDAALVARYDTLDLLRVRYGEQGRGLYLKHDVSFGQTLLVLPFSGLLHARNADRFLSSELLPSPQQPSHPWHWSTALSARAQTGEHGEAVGCRLPLTSVQALTLILAQWRTRKRTSKAQHSKDPKWSTLDTFLGSFPHSFASLPLHWQLLVEEDPESDATEEESHQRSNGSHKWSADVQRNVIHALKCILTHMPVHVDASVQKVYHRFQRDRAAIRAVQRTRPDLLDRPDFTDEDLAWAWAGVNSRCVFLPLDLKPHGDNFTLAPLLDMANHTMDRSRECKVRHLPTKALQLSAPARNAQIRSSASTTTKTTMASDSEVLISYGPHSNGFLLSEYGFTLPNNALDADTWHGNPYAEVQVDHIIQALLDEQGDQGTFKKQVLDQEGYWGEYTIHPHPAPAHPSYRLVLAMRLIALDLSGQKESERSAAASRSDKRLQSWRQNVQGICDDLGPQNETSVRSLLAERICNAVVTDAKHHRKALEEEEALLGLQNDQTVPEEQDARYNIRPADVRNAARTLMLLHLEEAQIAQMVQAAIARGETVW